MKILNQMYLCPDSGGKTDYNMGGSFLTIAVPTFLHYQLRNVIQYYLITINNLVKSKAYGSIIRGSNDFYVFLSVCAI